MPFRSSLLRRASFVLAAGLLIVFAAAPLVRIATLIVTEIAA